ncbi:MAG TPA: DUF4097 family beta strand repeat-containing protein, partial [Opitutus sp.]|nr:DUF4097 family beta strand repeat-containing protein [Opitutus sp.]
INVANGDLHIRGTDAAEITLRTDLKPEKSDVREDGLRVITTSSSYSLLEKDNVVTLSHGSEGWPGNSSDFDITVPLNTSVVIANAFGGDIRIENVTGDIEVKSLNGEVKLDGVAGGALVETMNGEIDVNVRTLVDNKPLSFTSLNGEVALRVPTDAKANVRLRTHNGTILTDFPETQLITKTATLKGESGHGAGAIDEDIRATVRDAVRVGMEAAREATRAARDAMREARENGHVNVDVNLDGMTIPVPPMPPLPPMTGGKIVTGTLNGGGPEILISTMNGDVTLRKAK